MCGVSMVVRGCAQVCAGVGVWVWVGVHGCGQVFTGMYGCSRVCGRGCIGVHGCGREWAEGGCADVHGCMHVCGMNFQ